MSKRKVIMIAVIFVSLAGGVVTSYLINSNKASNNINVEDMEFDTFDKALDNYVKLLNNWDYDGIASISAHYDNFNSLKDKAVFWKNIKGKVKKTEIIEDNDNSKLVKLTLGIKNPGLTALKKGINEKYIYISKYFLTKDDEDSIWRASPMVDNPDYIDVDYIGVEGDYQLEYGGDEKELDYKIRQPITNLGLGLSEDLSDEYIEYINGISPSKYINIDLNNDGKEEEISFLNEKLYINRGLEKQTNYLLENIDVKQYRIMDFDEYDGLLDIVLDVQDIDAEYDNYYSIVFRYDGDKLYEFDRCFATLNDALWGDKKYSLDLRYSLIGVSKIPVKIKKDKIEISKDWIKMDRDYYSYAMSFPTKRDVKVYTKPDRKSKKTTIKSGTYIYLTRFKLAEAKDVQNVSYWAEVVFNDGEKAYLYFKNFDHFETEDGDMLVDYIYGWSEAIQYSHIKEDLYMFGKY